VIDSASHATEGNRAFQIQRTGAGPPGAAIALDSIAARTMFMMVHLFIAIIPTWRAEDPCSDGGPGSSNLIKRNQEG
jgi:hypothetical protein